MEQATTTADPRIITVDEEGGVYDISSRTRAGLTHTANVLTGVCTCEAGQHNVECWQLGLCPRYSLLAPLRGARPEAPEAPGGYSRPHGARTYRRAGHRATRRPYRVTSRVLRLADKKVGG